VVDYQALQKIQAYRETNEVKMFPNTKNSVNRRRDLYISLSEEIRRLALAFKGNSHLHQQLFELVSKLWPLQTEKPTVPASSTTTTTTTTTTSSDVMPALGAAHIQRDSVFRQMDETLAEASGTLIRLASVVPA